MTELLLGFMTAAWLFTNASVAYVLWRYAYAPWKNVRKDLLTLDAKIIQGLKELTTRLEMTEQLTSSTRVHSMTDEELAQYELKLRQMRAVRRA